MPDQIHEGLFFDEFAGRDPQPQNLARAECGAAHRLIRQIERWLRGDLKGRSCLIAGPRGSGKTTLIDIAYQSTLFMVPGQRPVVVRLHGPSLLSSRSANATGAADQKADSANQSDVVTENVLKSLVTNLYQTVAEEFASAYREMMCLRTPEDQERAAQLRLTLDGAPGASTLREFWESADALETGVLFHPERLLRKEDREALRARPDQAKLEIAALATASEAYRMCTGKMEAAEKDEKIATREQELRTEASAKGKEIAQALVSVLAGLSVGGAASASGTSPTNSAVAGAVTALLGMTTLTYTSSMKRQSSTKREITFLPDLSVTVLVHRFPLLLRRLRQAGIAPIFVIDEIDKIHEAANSLNQLVSNLKFLCADISFFCFLTDRAYLSDVAQKSRDTSNNTLLTVYTDLMFVLYETSSFATYLDEVIEVPLIGDPKRQLELGWDKEALRLALVHRSRMLAFNLMREISEIRSPDNSLNIYQPRSSQLYQLFIVMQLAVEVVLCDPLVSERIRQDPDFGQIIYDAVYYPSRIWYQGQEEMDCTLEGLKRGMTSLSASGALAPGASDLTDYLGLLKEDDRKFLHAQVRILLGFVCEPMRLRDRVIELNGKNQLAISNVVADICSIAPVLLTRKPGPENKDKYIWRYNWYGIPYRTADMDEIMETVAGAEVLLDAMFNELAAVSTSPSVSEIEEASTPAIRFIIQFQRELSAVRLTV